MVKMIVTMITNMFQVEPNTVCQLGSKSKEFNDTKLTAKRFEEQECSQGRKEIPHRKMLPECRNVTKQNCVTLWETDDAGKKYFLCINIFQKKDSSFLFNFPSFSGNKQWAGTDSCEPVTWQECELVPKEVTFIVPDIQCSPKQEIWYHEPETESNIRDVTTFTCEPRASVKCVTRTRPVCKMATWQDCEEVPFNNCQPKSVHIPTQEYLHRKKCLLPDEVNSSQSPSGTRGYTNIFL